MDNNVLRSIAVDAYDVADAKVEAAVEHQIFYAAITRVTGA